MSWSNQGGGGPWGGGRGGGGGPGGQPPDFDEMLRRGQDAIKRIIPGGVGGGRGIALIGLVVVAIWLASGFYRVQPDEQGVVLRFGEAIYTTTPGLHYHWPTPIESVLTPKVTQVNQIDIGFQTARRRGGPVSSRDITEESLMLTGDENIVDIQFSVFWLIKDARDYLFNIRAPELTIKMAAESAMREIIGKTPIQPILAEGRRKVEEETEKLLQRVLDDYGSGIQITQLQLQKVDPPGPVVDSFRDVQRARADLERLRNEAEAYRNDIIPRARGEAAKLVQDAEAYKQEVVARSQGDAKRFLSVYNEYKVAKEVTTQRIYLETMEEILRRTNKIIIDSSGGRGPGVVPYLPLPEIRKRTQGGAK